MKTNVPAGLLLSLTMVGGAAAQMTGVSHPDQMPIVATSDAATPRAAKPSAQIPIQASSYQAQQPTVMASVPDPDGSIVEAVRPAQVVEASASDRMDGPMRDDSGGLRPNPDAGVVTRVEGPGNELPVGTLVKALLKNDLSTRSTLAGSGFTAELAEPVLRDGHVLLPAGSVITGKVTEVHGGKRISGGAALHLEPFSVMLPDGTNYKLRAQVIDTSLYGSTRVDSEGTITPRMHPRETVSVLALTTGAGAAAGAVFGGVPGALIGAGVGAGVTTAMLLKDDRQEQLLVGTRLVFSLTRPLAVGTSY